MWTCKFKPCTVQLPPEEMLEHNKTHLEKNKKKCLLRDCKKEFLKIGDLQEHLMKDHGWSTSDCKRKAITSDAICIERDCSDEFNTKAEHVDHLIQVHKWKKSIAENKIHHSKGTRTFKIPYKRQKTNK